MGDSPNNEQLKEFVNSLCELQGRIWAQIGLSTHFPQSQVVSVEPLKTPIYVMHQQFGYADFSDFKVQHQWLASFKASPSNFLSECIVQIKNGDIPVDDQTLNGSLVDFYSEMITAYEQ